MTLAVMGYHLQVITRKMSKAMDKALAQAQMEEGLPGETSGRQKSIGA
jgi:hypothetical protein